MRRAPSSSSSPTPTTRPWPASPPPSCCCAPLTGVEAISNGVPAFQKPKSRNAATTLLMMGVLSITMLGTIIGLGRATDIKVAERPAEQLALNGQAVGEAYIKQNPQDTVLGQLAHAVFGSFTPGIIYVSITP